MTRLAVLLLAVLPVAVLPVAVLPVAAAADPAQVVDAQAERAGGNWTITATLRHGDTGWDDYADAWRVLSDGGDVLGTRTLAHPHVDEQPFSRSLSGIAIPDGTARVMIETSTTTTGWGGERYALDLPG